ncbi:Cof-type HAD-IIB family hydrolase [Ammoniphilus resinae]|uniref:Cof subfamily protein (Haloacid dehalogenase superfamily) n=1 Tax=Ammoniphilus resinae TaxID=861532 RepID=A0ABS4GLS2_9BACL|nr:Cof-type HAD-IIB family hydrolase [Ammoniphilus resinae]MBP1931213.1 Cof subfamily protein (haloacid dehalogenase superfamily) [Ammoniphilus resinae]
MKSKYQLIALDIDGTLLNDHYECDGETRALLQSLEEAGLEIVLCTGRALEPTKKVAEMVGVGSYLITDNGSVTYHTPTRDAVSIKAIDPDYLENILEILNNKHVHIDVTAMEKMYTIPHHAEIADMYKKYMVNPVILEQLEELPEPILKATLYGSEKEIDQIYEELPQQLIPYQVQCFRSGPYFIDVMNKQATKGTALASLTKRLNISSNTVIAIGNYYNDIDMIRFAGMGVAMENAPEKVKIAADLITESNNQQGVKRALESLIG